MKPKIALILIPMFLILLATVSPAKAGITQEERGPAKLYFPTPPSIPMETYM